MDRLTDQSEMPFGKHRGRIMEKVPAGYLLWLWDEGLRHLAVPAEAKYDPQEKSRAVAHYIKDNFSALETEASDYIVIHRPERSR